MGFGFKKNFSSYKKPLLTSVLFCLFSVLFYGCGSSDESKVAFAITEAEIYLSSGDCNSALKALNAVGSQETNSRYLQTLASIYGCKAGYGTLTLFSASGDGATNQMTMTFDGGVPGIVTEAGAEEEGE